MEHQQLHPWCQQRTLVSYCQQHHIVIEAYSPIVRNQKAKDPTLVAISKVHGKSTAQILIRYALQKGWVPLPKSDTPSRIRENADVYDFELAEEQMAKLDRLDEGPRGAIGMFSFSPLLRLCHLVRGRSLTTGLNWTGLTDWVVIVMAADND
jgi:diketogulonate reductase-like aldo/keto reductase